MGGFRSVKDFAAWQLAYELRKKARPLMDRTRARNDFKLHEQIKDAARSATRNIAEGFGRFKHREFAQFVRIAKGSELELLDHFQEAFDCRYLNEQEFNELQQAASKAIKAATGLIRYLESTPDPR